MSTSMLTIRVRVDDARQALKHAGAGLRNLLRATGAALASKDRRAAAPKKLQPAPRLKTASGAWGDKALKAALWVRSGGRCECGCGRRLTKWDAETDHFWGRAKAAQRPETCWLLAAEHHREKTENRPSRVHWIRKFLVHLEAHGFGRSESAEKCRNELAAEEELAKAEQLSRRAIAGAGEMAARAMEVAE